MNKDDQDWYVGSRFYGSVALTIKDSLSLILWI